MMSFRLNLLPIAATPTLTPFFETNMVVRIFSGSPTRRSSWQLRNGPANPSMGGAPDDPESASEVPPSDYDAAENNRHWVRVG